MSNFGMILMTVTILQFTVIPPVADLNSSHATNPDWPGHARFHVVAQVLTTSALGFFAIYILWSGRLPVDLAVCIATILGSIALGSFFASVISIRHFGGVVNAGVGGAGTRLRGVDGNVVNFASAAVLLGLGRLLAL